MEEKKPTDEVVVAKNTITDEEIVKAVECCIKYNCKKCPYILKHIDCVSDKRAEKDFIDFIKRLQAQNAELQKQVDELKAENTELYKEHTALIAGSILTKQNIAKDTAKEILIPLIDCEKQIDPLKTGIRWSILKGFCKKFGIEME